MVTRSITKVGLMSIGRQVRGAALDGEVELRASNEGIIISPHNPGDISTDKKTYVARFDQYNRISLPSELRRATKIKKRVDVTQAGECLILSPAVEVCIVCGSGINLKAVPGDKFICDSCRKEMIKVSIN